MNKINQEDILLFRDTVNTQAPIDKDGVSRMHKLERKPPFTQYSHVIDGTIAGEEIVSYAKSGISEKMMNKMKRGHLDNVSELDLHGYTIKQTCEALSEFIYREQFEQFVRIIHGKGYRSDNKMSVLKTQVVNFLKQHPQVLAFHSCPPKDGGTGAIFALLKQQGISE